MPHDPVHRPSPALHTPLFTSHSAPAKLSHLQILEDCVLFCLFVSNKKLLLPPSFCGTLFCVPMVLCMPLIVTFSSSYSVSDHFLIAVSH